MLWLHLCFSLLYQAKAMLHKSCEQCGCVWSHGGRRGALLVSRDQRAGRHLGSGAAWRTFPPRILSCSPVVCLTPSLRVGGAWRKTERECIRKSINSCDLSCLVSQKSVSPSSVVLKSICNMFENYFGAKQDVLNILPAFRIFNLIIISTYFMAA